MKRIDTATRALNLFGAGKDGYKDGDLAGGTAPTDLNAAAMNGPQEEILAVVEASGIVASGADLAQLLKAMRRMFGGNVRTVTSGATVLTADDAGLVLINAAGGAVTVTLPAANVLKALPFKFRRIDTVVANSVTINRAGADTVDEGATSFTLTNRGDVREVVSDGVSSWRSVVGSNSALVAVNGYQRMPSGMIFQWGNTSTVGGGVADIIFPIAFPTTLARAIVSPQAGNYVPAAINASGPNGINVNIINAATAALAGNGIVTGFYAMGF